MSQTRIKGRQVSIKYDSTKAFFEARAQKFREDAPYVATMYQDKNPDLAKARDEQEKSCILPQLGITGNERVLDIGCGVGRWADILVGRTSTYVGIDFSEGLVDIARKRFSSKNPAEISFKVMDAREVKTLQGEFDLVIVSGVLLYLNDDDCQKVLQDIADFTNSTATIYIREPVATEERLTLNNFMSQELESEYSAIYRSEKSYLELFEGSLIKSGFRLSSCGFPFEGSLNNRIETIQKFYILKRG